MIQNLPDSLFSSPTLDLIALLFLIFSVLSGARRGLTGTVIGLFGRLAVVLGAGWLARSCAPALARAVVEPLVRKAFTSEMLQSLGEAAMLEQLEGSAVEIAAHLAQGIAFMLLCTVFLMIFSIALSLLTHSLNLITRFPPLGLVNRLAGAVLGFVGGAVLICILLWLTERTVPNTSQWIALIQQIK